MTTQGRLADFRCPSWAIRGDFLLDKRHCSALERLPPSSIVDGSLANMFLLLGKKESKQGKVPRKKRWNFFFRGERGNKNFFYYFLSVLVYFVSFMDCSRERTGRRRREGRNGTGNSSKQQEQQQTINKIPIDDEARLMHAYMWTEHSYLKAEEFSCLRSLFHKWKHFDWIGSPESHRAAQKEPETTIAQRHRN